MKRVALYQNDPRFGAVEANLAAARAALADVRADLVVLPELFASGYQFASADEVAALAEPVPGGPTTAALEAIARETGATVVAGIPERAADGRIYNAAAIVYPSGLLTTYRKLHLFHEERTWFAPGGLLPPVIRTPQGLRVGVMICFDWRFPEVARHLALEGADVIAHPSNLVRPHCPDAMVTRCLENKVYAATANRVGEEARGGRPPLRYIGRSQVVGPGGERLAALGATEAGVIGAEIDPAQARSKRVTGCDDIFAARRAGLIALAPRREAGERRYVVQRHDLHDGTHHLDLLLERDGVLLAWRLADFPPATGARAERNFDHRLRYLDFEGDLGGGRGAVRIVDRGTYRPMEEGAFALAVALGDGRKLRLVLDDPATDLWRIEVHPPRS